MTERHDCWNTIGVHGDHSCDKLATAVHCRNCPVYAGAARLQRQVPVDDDYRAAWAAVVAAPVPDAPRHDRAALPFRVGREWLALPAAALASVAPLSPAHRVPHRSGGALRGLANVDGRLLPVLALAELLGLEATTATPAGRHVFARQLVFAWDGVTAALPVDELDGLQRYAAADLQPPPSTVGRLGPHLHGVLPGDPRHIGLLDPDALARHCARLLR